MSNLKELTNHLFGQLDTLRASDLNGDALQEEIERSKAVTDLSRHVIDAAKVVLEAHKVEREYGKAKGLPGLLEDGRD